MTINSKYFTLEELISSPTARRLGINNNPSAQIVAALQLLVTNVLDPLREEWGAPIIVTSGYRSPQLNVVVGGARSSQHLLGQAADIRPRDPAQFQRLVDFLKAHQLTDQLLTGNGWLHISWSPFTTPRHQVRIGYYK